MARQVFMAVLGCTVLLAPAVAADSIRPKPAPPKTAWIARSFMGGPKCVASGPVAGFTAPGFEAEAQRLLALKVRPLRAYYRDHATCEACKVCPNYHREILFEIEDAARDQAQRAGYNAVTAPDPEELATYERGKVYRPPPDVPGPAD